MPSIEKRIAGIHSSMPVCWERKKKRKWNLLNLNIYDDDYYQREEEEESCCDESTMWSSNVDLVLPYNIIINEILLRLPAKYLLRFRLVSKYWLHYISDPKFVKMHLNFQAMNKPPWLMMRICWCHPLCQVRFDDEENGSSDLLQQLRQQQQNHQQQQQENKSVQFWGSSNGLVCLELFKSTEYSFKTTRSERVCLWNPCTKEFKRLPYKCIIFPPDNRSGSSFNTNFGFGYGSTTDDYKVIRNTIYYDKNGQFLHTLVEVYTLRKDSWKVIGKYPYEVAQHHIGVYVNGGGVYWLARSRQSMDIIICFDIASEHYKEISSPPSVVIKTVEPRECYHHNSSKYVKLTELKGFLCIINPILEQKCLEVWAMNKELSSSSSSSNWSKLFTIREPIIALSNQLQDSLFELLGSYKNNDDQILVLVDRKELLLYNPKNDKTRALIHIDDADAHDTDKFREVQTCIDSLVSLNPTGDYDNF